MHIQLKYRRSDEQSSSPPLKKQLSVISIRIRVLSHVYAQVCSCMFATGNLRVQMGQITRGKAREGLEAAPGSVTYPWRGRTSFRKVQYPEQAGLRFGVAFSSVPAPRRSAQALCNPTASRGVGGCRVQTRAASGPR